MNHSHVENLVHNYHTHSANPEEYVINYNKVFGLISNLACYVRQKELAGFKREQIIEELHEVREIFSKVPFMNRTQVWPRGYQGDFETIEHLFWGTNMAKENSFEYFVEEYALASSTAQQHRNKVKFQANLILQTILHHSKANILSIGCGGCIDVRTIMPFIKDKDFNLVLNDMDHGALEFSRQKLNAIGDKCHFINENIIKSNKVKEKGPYDLVITGGVFDYLKDKAIGLLLKNFRENLMKPGATFFFTNIKKGNPIRMQIEYFGNWILIERSSHEIREICAKAGFADNEIMIEEDSSRLTFLVTLHKIK